MPVKEIGCKHGFSDSSFYKWRSKYGGMDASGWSARGFALGTAAHGIGAARALQVNERRALTIVAPHAPVKIGMQG